MCRSEKNERPLPKQWRLQDHKGKGPNREGPSVKLRGGKSELQASGDHQLNRYKGGNNTHLGRGIAQTIGMVSQKSHRMGGGEW